MLKGYGVSMILDVHTIIFYSILNRTIWELFITYLASSPTGLGRYTYPGQTLIIESPIVYGGVTVFTTIFFYSERFLITTEHFKKNARIYFIVLVKTWNLSQNTASTQREILLFLSHPCYLTKSIVTDEKRILPLLFLSLYILCYRYLPRH